MQHVTFMLIVESENINSIRALCLVVCFERKIPQSTAHAFGCTLVALAHENHQFRRPFGIETMKKETIRNEFGAWQSHHVRWSRFSLTSTIHLESKRLVSTSSICYESWFGAWQNEIYAAFSSTNRDHHVKFNCYNRQHESIEMNTKNMKRFRAGFCTKNHSWTESQETRVNRNSFNDATKSISNWGEKLMMTTMKFVCIAHWNVNREYLDKRFPSCPKNVSAY